MQAFLYLDLKAVAAYHKALPAHVKKELPAVAVLDVDTSSGELTLHYALRLLRESEKAVVYVSADASRADFGGTMPLLEELFEGRAETLVLLDGNHPRLLRMLQARPQVQFRQVNEEEALAVTKAFLENSVHSDVTPA
ncbi:hypothetical protein ACXYMU_00645 [Pontibacter sp. CAU 1760]